MTDAPERIWMDGDIRIGEGYWTRCFEDRKPCSEPALEYLRADHALALVAEAYEVAAENCDVVTQDHIGDIVRGIGDEIRAMTPCDALAAREADRKRVRDEALREGRGVKVKPLEWRDSYGVLRAKTPFGDYMVTGKILKMPVTSRAEMYADDPKAAAQADYERRILSALSPASVSVGRDDIRDAFIAGATAVHKEWQDQYEAGIAPPRDADFYEAADDYATAALAETESRGDDANR